MKTYEITAAAALAAISVVLQVVHVGWASPWGMWIDLVSVSWIIAYLLYGGRTSIIVSVVVAIMITLVAPSTWLGAALKWVATMPMIVIPMIMQKTMGLKLQDFRKPSLLVLAIAAAVVLRVLIVIPANYYFAIPVWTGWSPAESMTFVPWWAIMIMNVAQGAIEVVLAWLLVFRFRLDRFSSWQSK